METVEARIQLGLLGWHYSAAARHPHGYYLANASRAPEPGVRETIQRRADTAEEARRQLLAVAMAIARGFLTFPTARHPKEKEFRAVLGEGVLYIRHYDREKFAACQFAPETVVEQTTEDRRELDRRAQMRMYAGDYQAYLGSEWWKKRRQRALERAGFRCEECGNPGLEVHHLNYDHLGDERDEDLRVMCGCAHKQTHEDSNQKEGEPCI